MDGWIEPSNYSSIQISGARKRLEDQKIETLKQRRQRQKKTRNSIKHHLEKAGLYRNTRTGKVMHQVKDKLVETDQ